MTKTQLQVFFVYEMDISGLNIIDKSIKKKRLTSTYKIRS
jgi:hypothetical protein